MTTDCNSRYCHLDPNLGAQLAVAEAARNIVATGARPLAITDCLNFANPDRPEVYWELEETIAGLAQACRALDLPIVERQRQPLQRNLPARGEVSSSRSDQEEGVPVNSRSTRHL